MPRKHSPNASLPTDPVGDALADVYLFLMRQAAERKQDQLVTERVACSTQPSVSSAEQRGAIGTDRR